MRKIVGIILIIAMSVLCFGCSNKESQDPIKVEMTVREYGVITFELYPDKAPITVDNFVKLAESGFYDGMRIHRVQQNFVIQGGNPQLVGKSAVPTIKGEFAANGVKNDLEHMKGALSMARQGNDYNSASSQFFICSGDCRSSLDGKYACFGYVVSGMNVVDMINSKAASSAQMGMIENVADMPIIDSVKVIRNQEG